MPIKKTKPTTPSRRQMSFLVSDEITKSTPEKSLVGEKRKRNGHNNVGRITVRHRGGGAQRKYRIIDFKRNKFDVKLLLLNTIQTEALT